jgi:hypothetical protein
VTGRLVVVQCLLGVVECVQVTVLSTVQPGQAEVRVGLTDPVVERGTDAPCPVKVGVCVA